MTEQSKQRAGERARDEKRENRGPVYGGEKEWKVADERGEQRFGHARNDDADPSELIGRAHGTAGEAAPELMRLAWFSAAGLAIAPLQDLLNLGNEARMNVPGQAEGNWRWRCTEAWLGGPVFEWLHDLTKTAGRLLAGGRTLPAGALSSRAG